MQLVVRIASSGVTCGMCCGSRCGCAGVCVCVPVIGDDTQMTAAGNSISLPHTKKSKPISKYFRSFYLLFLRKVFTLSHVAGALKWHKHMLHMVYKLIYIYLSSPSLSLSPPLSLLLHMQHAK